jgi:hypothetical protein
LIGATFTKLLLYTGAHHPDTGSFEGFDLRVWAAWAEVSVDLIEKVIKGLREFGLVVGNAIANWTKRQGAAAAKHAPGGEQGAVSAGAQRMRRYRKRKAEDSRQGEFAFAADAHEPDEDVTSRVTVTAEEEGFAQRIPHPSSTTESVRAKAGFDQHEEGDSFGRNAPFDEPRSSEKVVNLSPALKAKKKEMRRQKVMRFVYSTYEGEERDRRINGMMGLDSYRDEQWWFDKCDAERQLANWDDVRDRHKDHHATWRKLA